ncbi:MAG: hypothetical protein SF002_07225 [Alphaproteobacteria bacterium]|nr:hypothetical protein [Alphaproteobacteria bacterium]
MTVQTQSRCPIGLSGSGVAGGGTLPSDTCVGILWPSHSHKDRLVAFPPDIVLAGIIATGDHRL